MASAASLYDACAEAAAARPRWRHGRPVLWLTAPAVHVGARAWRARASRPSAGDRAVMVHGYSARQCGQIAAALIPVMGGLSDAVVRDAAVFLGLGGTPPPNA